MVRRGRGSSKKFKAKGRSRYVASEDEIIARNKSLERDESDEPDGNTSGDSDSGEGIGENPGQEYLSDLDRSSSDQTKDTHNLIEICNPNRNLKGTEKAGVVELSRREKEELKRQNFERQKMKLMAQGKLESARADLARLKEVRKARELALSKKMG